VAGRKTFEQLLAEGEISTAPVERACRDQTFELPIGIYIAMASLFAGFIAVLGLAFRGGHMAVAIGVIFAFIAAFFSIPALFPAVAKRGSRNGALSWFEFGHRGVDTATGHSTAREATVLVLLLPLLIFCFAIAVVTIASLT
jgi:hypothetical protein